MFCYWVWVFFKWNIWNYRIINFLLFFVLFVWCIVEVLRLYVIGLFGVVFFKL